MTLAIVVALLVVAGVVIAVAARLRRRPPPDVVTVEQRHVPDMERANPVTAPPEPEPEPVITWTAALTETALDESARLRLIDDLTLLDAPWTIALLRQAHQEESAPALRDRIQAALTSSGEPLAATSS